ncbi:MAG: hypothetical protein ABIF82_00945 [Planctomycetota bacterium]
MRLYKLEEQATRERDPGSRARLEELIKKQYAAEDKQAREKERTCRRRTVPNVS